MTGHPVHQHLPTHHDDGCEQPLSRETPPPPGYEPPLEDSPLLDHLADDEVDVAAGESP
ncbi:hypothetical protein [Knoellia flava]|uniref:hypothetical protein n=1 Tax=Knoellia flava TaxID=913969 RepID=UPI0012EBB7A0|nr:hypothetical protein [Knoellia flava]